MWNLKADLRVRDVLSTLASLSVSHWDFATHPVRPKSTTDLYVRVATFALRLPEAPPGEWEHCKALAEEARALPNGTTAPLADALESLYGYLCILKGGSK